jgi:hypothetical protein
MSDNLQLPVPESAECQVYSTPAIVHELKLETRAGSPLRPGLTDPLGIDPTQPQVN